MKQKTLRLCLTALVVLISAAGYAYDACIDGIYYEFSKNTATVTYKERDAIDNLTAYVGEVLIPKTVDYNGKTYEVTSIDFAAFQGCSELTRVDIPSSVTDIGSRAFFECSKLTYINIPQSVTSIGDRAFSGCM